VILRHLLHVHLGGLLVRHALLCSELLLDRFDRHKWYALVLALNVALHEGLRVHTWRQEAFLSEHHDFLLLLALFYQQVVASLGLSARIFRLHVFLEFLLVDDLVVGGDIVLYLHIVSVVLTRRVATLRVLILSGALPRAAP